MLSPPLVLRNQLAGPVRFVMVDKSNGLQLDGMLERDAEEHWHAISPQKEVELTLQLQGYSSPHVAIIAGVDLKGTVDRNWAGERKARRLARQARKLNFQGLVGLSPWRTKDHLKLYDAHGR